MDNATEVQQQQQTQQQEEGTLEVWESMMTRQRRSYIRDGFCSMNCRQSTSDASEDA